MSKAIVININKDGTTAVQVTGAQGGECLKMTQKLEETLGKTKSVRLTSDYYTAIEKQHVREKL